MAISICMYESGVANSNLSLSHAMIILNICKRPHYAITPIVNALTVIVLNMCNVDELDRDDEWSKVDFFFL